MGPPPVTPVEPRRQTIDKYRSLLRKNSASTGRVLLDQMTILDLDETMSEMFGIHREAYAGHHIARLFPLRNCMRLCLFSLLRALSSGNPIIENLLTPQGDEVPTEWSFRILQRSEINTIYLAEVKPLGRRLPPLRSLLHTLAQPGRHIEFLRDGYRTFTRTGSTFPMWRSAELEIQSNCNMDCFFCPRFKDRSGIRKDPAGRNVIEQMPDKKFYSLINQLAQLDYRGVLKKHRLSEPFLDKRYEMFTLYVREKSGMSQWEDTNGAVLAQNPELCQRLDGLVDGLTIGLYDIYTAGELNREIEVWKSRFRKTRVCFSVPQWNCTIRARASDSVDRSLAHPVYHDFPCPQPYHFLMIRYDGVCGMCCGDDYGEFKLGNAFETPIRDLYWSPERMAIARTLSRPGGRKKVGSPCASCLEGTVSAHLMQDA